MFVMGVGKLKEEWKQAGKKMGGEEQRNGEMEAVKNQSMRRRKIVEERERNREKSTWEVKPG